MASDSAEQMSNPVWEGYYDLLFEFWSWQPLLGMNELCNQHIHVSDLTDKALMCESWEDSKKV